ncbi:MAG TPA: hypothetical protein VKU79_03160 [Thermoplasmataceae archaeon]|nr:hypothetical protein [Thermoplasmatales archaeon AK]HLH85848.1 hypothetical protein [Thermoplasmataceae archaeon]
MKIEIGQRFDFEVDREDIESVESGSIIATWYHMGNPIYVELSVNRSLSREIRKVFRNNHNKTALISIARVSKSRYVVSPTVVLLNRAIKDVKQVK